MDIRFLLILAVVAAVMEILGRLARKGAGTEAPRVPSPDSVDPSMPRLEDLDWRPGVHQEEDEQRAARESAPTEGPAPLPEQQPRRVREPDPLPPPPRPMPPAVPREGYRDRTPRPVILRSREARPIEPRPERKPPAVGPPVPEPAAAAREQVLPGALRQRRAPSVGSIGAPTGAGRGGRLGLGSTQGLRGLVVAREVLGPPLALRDGERRT